MSLSLPPRLRLAHLPTPLVRYDALDALVGTQVWVKRDDCTAGPEAGNKIRKLEYLLAAAQAERASVVITCGGEQSNHARATALLARSLGMRSLLFLRTQDGAAPARPWPGNLLLDALAGAELRFITPAQYRERDTLLLDAKRELERAGEHVYVIPEGGSNGLGA
ncbi:MAG TPA: pyridoxal-phosphate dependent enzyme, partial [Polyangiales bacterium]|nr:pyridoxal-phosphate dependent enzyme [Polyangiales bacterium]